MKSIVILLLFTTSLLAQEPDSSSAIYRMREAERDFARASVMFGRNAAFVQNLDEVAIVFTDSWIKTGKQFSLDRKPAPYVLKWEPEFMDISASRDFGISTGPWELQEYRPNTPPLSTGYFLTVWKRNSEGKWKVILDDGAVTPPKKSDFHRFSFPQGADNPVPAPEIGNPATFSDELISREGQMLTAWKADPVTSTYISFLAPGVRFLLPGKLPSVNADTIRLWIGQLYKSVAWKTSGSGAASSGDLGFTYGIIEPESGSGVLKGHYVRIWRKENDGKWYIILESKNS